MFLESGLLIDERGITDKKIRDYTPQELLFEWETEGGIRPTEAGLEKIDYILPRLLQVQSKDS